MAGGVASLAFGAAVAFVAGPIVLGMGSTNAAHKDPLEAIRVERSNRANPLSGVVTYDGYPLDYATVTAGTETVVTDETGAFSFDSVPLGMITVTRPAFDPYEYEFDGSVSEVDLSLSPRIVRALHISSTWAVDDTEMERLIELANVTTVNAFVFDANGDDGFIDYRTEVPAAIQHHMIADDPYDIEEKLRQSQEVGLYTILRITTFKNPLYIKYYPQHALSGSSYLDPGKKEAWEYPLSLAVEGCELGFDEINFDYIRYPDTFFKDTPRSQSARVANITGFLEEAASRLHPLGCALSADSFGLVTTEDNDQGVGQLLEDFAAHIDAYAPMTYPELWAAGSFGLSQPWNKPKEVVTAQLDSAIPRMPGGTVLRPWLRASWWPDSWILVQIEVAEDRGLGWLMWDAYDDPVDVSSFPPGTTGEG